MRYRGLITTSLTATALFMSLAAKAQTPALMAEVDRACAKTSDPNEVPYRFTPLSGKYAGQCMDTTRFRAIQNLKIDGAKASFNNYNHQNEFWQANFSIAPENIDAVIFQIVKFPILGVVEAAHTQVRFRLKQPVQLVNQLDSKKTAQNNDILVSFEATRPEKEGYNFALGAIETYALVAKIGSAAQKKAENLDQPFEQYELNLSPQEGALFLKNSLERGISIGNKFTYNTLRPNCTTEQFDLMDALPSLKGKHEPFLTMISNDPVAKPSVAALQKRNLLKNRIQDFDDELKGIAKTIPLAPKTEIPFLPSVKDKPYTLVITMPDLKKLSQKEQQAILRIRSTMIRQAPLLVQGLGSAMMKEAGSSSTEIAIGVLKTLQAQAATALRAVNDDLPNTPQSLGLYLVPYKAGTGQTSVTVLGAPAALPFGISDVVVDDSIPRSKDVYYHIAEGARSAGDVGAQSKNPAYFVASAIRLHIQRDRSQVRSQILAGINDQTKPFNMTNSQVAFNESVIAGAKDRMTRPVMLVSHTQKDLNIPQPEVVIEFGSEGGLAGTMAGEGFATFQIRKELNGSCEIQAQSSPTLRGVLAASALGKPVLDRLIQGKKVAFHILGAKLDAKTLQISSMDVRVSTWPIDCVSSSDVNRQFQQNANDMLSKLKAEAASGDLLKKLVNGYLN